jgi:uncharacterized protein YecT (DUF1311 family)
MMILRLTLLKSFAFLCAAPASAEMYGQEYQACSNGTSVATVKCLDVDPQAWDARLNVAYRTAMKSVEPGPLRALDTTTARAVHVPIRICSRADSLLFQAQTHFPEEDKI